MSEAILSTNLADSRYENQIQAPLNNHVPVSPVAAMASRYRAHSLS